MEGTSVEVPRGVGSGEGVFPSPVGEGFGKGAVPPPQKIFVILYFKWCIFMQFGIGIFTLEGVWKRARNKNLERKFYTVVVIKDEPELDIYVTGTGKVMVR